MFHRQSVLDAQLSKMVYWAETRFHDSRSLLDLWNRKSFFIPLAARALDDGRPTRSDVTTTTTCNTRDISRGNSARGKKDTIECGKSEGSSRGENLRAHRLFTQSTNGLTKRTDGGTHRWKENDPALVFSGGCQMSLA